MTSATNRKQEPYELHHDLDGTATSVRANLIDILERELLGPAGGENETLSSQPDGRYLVGRIAPVKLTRSKDDPSTGGQPAEDGSAVSQGDSDADPDTDIAALGDELDANDGRGVPVLSLDETATEADEDTGGDRDDEPVKRGLMIPASMGLRFQVPLDLSAFQVAAEWGVYNPERTGEVTAAGRDVRVYVRTPIHHRINVPLAELTPGVTAEYPLQDNVMLRIDSTVDSDRLLVEIALCNDRETPRRIPVNAWMFQTRLQIDAGDAEVFLPVNDVMDAAELDDDPNRAEERRLALQYRDRLEFAVGRTCSADWTVRPGVRKASRVRTNWLPHVEVPQVDAADIPDAVLDMAVLAKVGPAELRAGLEPLVTSYRDWLKGQQTLAQTLPQHLRPDALELVAEAEQVCAQLADGLAFLLDGENVEARLCFAFMNQVMADQRVHTQLARLRAENPALGREAARKNVLADGPKAHSWRAFQLAFVLMQLPTLCDPTLPRRSGDAANVELLFFPTGGGKTEAYLGLAAFTFAIRRRQGRLVTPDGELNGLDGVAVLMRYTLRLLTAQQFQRATALICAAELLRAADPETWGEVPFRIGLWVGTGVSPKYVADADDQVRDFNAGKGGAQRVTVLQIQRCPWCGTPITPTDVTIDKAAGRVFVRCGDELGDCEFAGGGTIADGLPVLTVDEEIYRLVPAFVIATVDKFARLAREGQSAALFGRVAAKCDQHGYVHPDDKNCRPAIGNRHPGGGTVRATSRLRPPDLIIQDELHLITGALGTTVGLFEVAVDTLASWRFTDGSPVRPAIVASSATVRNAPDQVRGLYGRGVTVFPPQVLDAANTFFSQEVPVDLAHPGRYYFGVSTTGVRLVAAEIRLAEVLLAAGQELLDRAGAAADPYLTLVGYFSATRELAGMARFLADEVQTAIGRGRRPDSRLARRYGTQPSGLNVDELTSRVSGTDITRTLDAMEEKFDPVFDSTQGKRALGQAREHGEPVAKRQRSPYDAVLATSMLQVGVDVSRLGLMLLVGQPKNTAEYIQASSRVGRDPHRPGLVVTLGNWARPRDLAHYEQFRHYHETFYAQVEPLSVTPFSVTSLERGLDGVLVSAARALQVGHADGLSPERNAGQIADRRQAVEQLIERLVARISLAGDEASTEQARVRLVNRLGQWLGRRTSLLGQAGLSYEKVLNTAAGGRFEPLLRSAESIQSRADAVTGPPFVVANSMREVQPEINLLVSPKPENLMVAVMPTTPQWRPQPPAGATP